MAFGYINGGSETATEHQTAYRRPPSPWLGAAELIISWNDIHHKLPSRHTAKTASPEGVLICHVHLNWRPVQSQTTFRYRRSQWSFHCTTLWMHSRWVRLHKRVLQRIQCILVIQLRNVCSLKSCLHLLKLCHTGLNNYMATVDAGAFLDCAILKGGLPWWTKITQPSLSGSMF